LRNDDDDDDDDNDLFFSTVQQSLEGQGRLNVAALLSQSDTPRSLGLLWTSDQPDSESPTWQYTTVKTDRHPDTGVIRTHNSSKWAQADPRLRRRRT
jgi:hypothetical protein